MRHLILPLAALVLAHLGSAGAAAQEAPMPPMVPLKDFSKLKDGDMIFILSHTDNAQYIGALSSVKLTHCGMIFIEGGIPIVYEGAGRGPGVHRNIKEWQKKESDGKPLEPVYVRRLKASVQTLTPDKLKLLKAEATKLHDDMYDFAFSWTDFEKKHPQNEYIYCSEFLYKVCERALGIKVGTLKTLGTYETSSTNPKVAEMKQMLETYSKALDCRDQKPVDLNDLAITPADVFASDKLDNVTD